MAAAMSDVSGSEIRELIGASTYWDYSQVRIGLNILDIFKKNWKSNS
jgi:hypothetical protein